MGYIGFRVIGWKLKMLTDPKYLIPWELRYHSTVSPEP